MPRMMMQRGVRRSGQPNERDLEVVRRYLRYGTRADAIRALTGMGRRPEDAGAAFDRVRATRDRSAY